MLLSVSLFVTGVKAQSTYAQVYHIIQTRCAGSSCHDGSVATFNIYVSADSLYNELVNVTPLNPAAAANFNKLINPGDVQRSFLLRKLAHGISDGLVLTQPEGSYMPNNLPAIPKNEIELVRQWILYGAPKTGNVVDTAMINTYYRSGGVDDTYSSHPAPAAGTGFQLYFGRLFLNAGVRDTEIFYKINPHLTQPVESNRVDFMMPANDHHFVMFLFQPGGDAAFPAGIRPLNQTSMEFDQYGIGAGPGLWPLDLPTNTAFYFNQGQVFDFDVHIENPNPDSIYSCDIYVNVYTEDANTTNVYMKTANFINDQITIPQDNQPHSFPLLAADSTRTNNWNIWKLYSHTHRYGTAFNMWLRNPDGTKGAQIYDGDYSYEDGFEVGYYRWGAHVTVRTWANDSLFPVNPLSGIISEATWMNTAGPNPVNWGFSAYDEMQVIFFLYVDGDPINATAVSKPVSTDLSAQIYPNPVSDEFVLKYNIANTGPVRVDLTDMVGNKVANLLNEQAQSTGQYTHTFNTAAYNLTPGIYLVSFDLGGKTETQKLIITE